MQRWGTQERGAVRAPGRTPALERLDVGAELAKQGGQEERAPEPVLT